MADQTIVLKWKCDGDCGKTLVEGVDPLFILRHVKKGTPEEGQLLRLCVACAESQLRKHVEV